MLQCVRCLNLSTLSCSRLPSKQSSLVTDCSLENIQAKRQNFATPLPLHRQLKKKKKKQQCPASLHRRLHVPTINAPSTNVRLSTNILTSNEIIRLVPREACHRLIRVRVRTHQNRAQFQLKACTGTPAAVRVCLKSDSFTVPTRAALWGTSVSESRGSKGMCLSPIGTCPSWPSIQLTSYSASTCNVHTQHPPYKPPQSAKCNKANA